MILNAIERDIMNAPTMMTVDEELGFFERLMRLPSNEFRNNWDAFSAILDRLYESHTQSFFDVNPNNKAEFLNAANWLDSIAGDFEQDPQKAVALRAFAKHFRIDPARI